VAGYAQQIHRHDSGPEHILSRIRHYMINAAHFSWLRFLKMIIEHWHAQNAGL
jgi:hypothetical protein